MTLFSKINSETQTLIDDNVDLINQMLPEWIERERLLKKGLCGQALNYLTIAKRRRNPSQKTLRENAIRKNLVNKLVKMGYTFENLKATIDFKIGQWWGTEWQGHLTPETLFASTNFPKYFEATGSKESIPNGEESPVNIGEMGSMSEED